mmetsp:Transcript_157894/g.483878  ORF Transcript_157894/g.483878 Transcript_157894/m.483878 type:complete len:283 (+) Transcript_157894:56-904(+)
MFLSRIRQTLTRPLVLLQGLGWKLQRRLFAGQAGVRADRPRRPGRAAFMASAWLFGGLARPVHTAAHAVRSPPGARLLAHTKVVPYGVLGSSNSGTVAAEPDDRTAFVDPAGLHHIQGGPGGAGGAAGVIYRWLGISTHPSFPEAVRAAITAPLQAKFHAYGASGEKKCIHVVGPDFRHGQYTREKAEDELAMAYFNVFKEFRASGLQRLRLLPVSGGIFSGPFGGCLPELTASALDKAFDRLDAETQAWVLGSHVEMCIYMEDQAPAFREAFVSPGSAAKL